jgi:murein L,D-transpeptidase YafK
MTKIPLLLLILLLLPCCGGKARDVKKRIEPDLKTALEKEGLNFGSPVFIRAFKEERILELFMKNGKTEKFELFRTYPIVAASGMLGPKLAEGDRQVPEGFYFAGPQAMNPKSSYHLSFNIGFPNSYDRAHDRTGSFIMIHGSYISIGCLAMTDEKIEEIYTLADAALAADQPFFRIHIFPFRMTDERMAKATEHEWIDFWKNLKTGYDLFEKNKVPPNTTVKDQEYAFE